MKSYLILVSLLLLPINNSIAGNKAGLIPEEITKKIPSFDEVQKKLDEKKRNNAATELNKKNRFRDIFKEVDIIEFVFPIDSNSYEDELFWRSRVTARMYAIKVPGKNAYEFRFRATAPLYLSLQKHKDLMSHSMAKSTCGTRIRPNNDYNLNLISNNDLKFTTSVTVEKWLCGRFSFGIGNVGYKTKLGKHVAHIESTINLKANLSDVFFNNSNNDGPFIESNFSKEPHLTFHQIVKIDNRIVHDENYNQKFPITIGKNLNGIEKINFKEKFNGIVLKPKFTSNKVRDKRRDFQYNAPYYLVYELVSQKYRESLAKDIMRSFKDAKLCLNGTGFKAKGSYEYYRWPDVGHGAIDENSCANKNK